MKLSHYLLLLKTVQRSSFIRLKLDYFRFKNLVNMGVVIPQVTLPVQAIPLIKRRIFLMAHLK
jgi:hypothetical protein